MNRNILIRKKGNSREKTKTPLFRFSLSSVVCGLLLGSVSGTAQTEDFSVRTQILQLHKNVISLVKTNQTAALKYALLAEKASRDIANPDIRAQSLIDIGLCYYYNDQLDSALYFVRRSQVDLPALHDTTRARIFTRLGSILGGKGVVDSAVYFHLKALRLSEKSGNKSDQVKSLFFLGMIANNSADQKQALYYFNRCLKLAEQSKDPYLLAFASEGLASYYFHSGLLERSIALYDSAIVLYEKADDEYDQARCLINLGSLYDEREQIDKALVCYQSALKYFLRLQDAQNILSAYSNLGALYLYSNDVRQAEHYLVLAANLGRQLGYVEPLQNIYENLSDVYQLKNKPDSALKYLQLATNLKDSILSLERLKEVQRLQEIYQKEKREQEISRLQARQQFVDQEMRMERQQNVYLILGLFLVSLLVVVIYFVFRQRARNMKKLAEMKADLYRKHVHEVIKEHELKSINQVMEGQEYERKRIAEDLHDRLGSMLSSIKMHFNAVEEKLDKLEVTTLQQYNQANNLLDVVCSEVRNIAHNMESGVLHNFGLVAALEDLRDTLKTTGELTLVLSTFGMKERLSADIEIAIYRIIQELLSNTIRHSGAKKITIDINREANLFTLIYSDNGKGYEPELHDGEGMGLRNIQSRMARLGGKFYVDSGKNNGTTSILTIPLNYDKGLISG